MTTSHRPARAVLTASGIAASTALAILGTVPAGLLSSIRHVPALRPARPARLTGKAAVVSASVALAAIAAAPMAAASDPSWAIQATANPAGTSANILSAVSCSSATACMAVGYHMTTNYGFAAMAESWNGSTWTLTATDPALTTGSALDGVSCTSADVCSAVGWQGSVPVAERWNGTRWTGQPLPAATGILSGVSCPSATACMAVGSADGGTGISQGLAMYWNGSTWTIRPVQPAPPGASASFNAVSCSSSADCLAVGQSDPADASGTAWAEHWNGATWSGGAVPAPGSSSSLQGVSCASANACTAVGDAVPTSGNSQDTDVPLAERWNGTIWALQDAPPPPGTVGNFPTLPPVPHPYPGPTPTPRPPVSPGQHGPYPSQLWAVSCASSAACAAVGEYGNAIGGKLTLAESWDGTGWTTQPAPDPALATQSSLLGVSCTSAALCTAAGSWNSWTAWPVTSGFYPIYTLAERYS